MPRRGARRIMPASSAPAADVQRLLPHEAAGSRPPSSPRDGLGLEADTRVMPIPAPKNEDSARGDGDVVGSCRRHRSLRFG